MSSSENANKAGKSVKSGRISKEKGGNRTKGSKGSVALKKSRENGAIRGSIVKQKLSEKRMKVRKAEESESEKSDESEESDESDENDKSDMSVSSSASENESDSEEEGSSSDSIESSKNKKATSTDSASFATAIGALLGSRLKAHDRSDPIFVRQKKTVLKQKQDEKLELKAKKLLNAEKKHLYEKARIKEVLPKDDETAREILDYEKKLKKTAQRGVIKLFNAIMTSQGGEVEEEENSLSGISKEKFMDMVKGAK